MTKNQFEAVIWTILLVGQGLLVSFKDSPSVFQWVIFGVAFLFTFYYHSEVYREFQKSKVDLSK